MKSAGPANGAAGTRHHGRPAVAISRGDPVRYLSLGLGNEYDATVAAVRDDGRLDIEVKIPKTDETVLFSRIVFRESADTCERGQCYRLAQAASHAVIPAGMVEAAAGAK